MKKFTTFLLSLLIALNSIAQFPFSFVKNRVPNNANAYFTAVGDIPSGAQTAINTWVASLKSAGVYNSLSFAYLFPPSLTNSNGLIEFVSCSALASFGNTATSPFNTSNSTVAPHMGYIVVASATSYIKTGIVPIGRFNMYDHAIFETTGPLTVSGNYDNGSFVSVAQAMSMNNYYTGGNQRVQRYNNTLGQGLFSSSGATGAAGTYWTNTNSSTFVEWGVDGTQKGTGSTNGGTLPDIQMYLGCLNNAGTASTTVGKIVKLYIGFKRGLTTTERAAVVTANNQLCVDLKRSSFTQKIVIDGNSHTQYWNEKVNRTLQYNLNAKSIEFVNYGISGQTTTQLLSDETTQIVPAYNSGYSKNGLVVYEMTNDMQAGKTVKQAIDSMKKYVSIAKAAGYTVFVKKQFCRLNPGSGGGVVTYPNVTKWNLAVDTVNSMLDTNAVHADYILPVDATHFIARSGYASDAAYNTAVSALLSANFLDGIHLPEAGYKTEADLDFTIINPLFTSIIKLHPDICTNKTQPKIIDLYYEKNSIAA